MPSSPILMTPESHATRTRRDIDPAMGWTALLVLAVALVLVSTTDLGLAVYPFNFGNTEWRFTVLASVANGLPMLTLGAVLTLIVVLPRSAGWSVAALLLNAVVLVAIAAAAVGFLTATGAAFAKAPAEVHLGLEKAVVKSTILFVVFGAAHAVALVAGGRSLQRRRNHL
jgi:hypothetical protein